LNGFLIGPIYASAITPIRPYMVTENPANEITRRTPIAPSLTT